MGIVFTMQYHTELEFPETLGEQDLAQFSYMQTVFDQRVFQIHLIVCWVMPLNPLLVTLAYELTTA